MLLQQADHFKVDCRFCQAPLFTWRSTGALLVCGEQGGGRGQGCRFLRQVPTCALMQRGIQECLPTVARGDSDNTLEVEEVFRSFNLYIRKKVFFPQKIGQKLAPVNDTFL